MSRAQQHRKPVLKSGVYVLKRKSKVIYVGQSTNVFNRVKYHEIKFDDAIIELLPENRIGEREVELIAKLNPSHNANHIPIYRGDSLLLIRINRGLSAKAISKKLGISERSYLQMEQNKKKCSQFILDKAASIKKTARKRRAERKQFLNRSIGDIRNQLNHLVNFGLVTRKRSGRYFVYKPVKF